MSAQIIPFVPKPRPLSPEEQLRNACALLGITDDDMPSEARRRPPEPQLVTIQMDPREAAMLRRLAIGFFGAQAKEDAP
jgi:hypothetical protein